MTSGKRILVIGAGASGLAAIKSCKEESLDVLCYEKNKNFGGRWRYTKNFTTGQGSVMKSTVSIFSKEMGAFSDFPPPTDFPNYLHNTKMVAYLTLYAKKFDLLPHIKFQIEVIRIKPSLDYECNGKWLVTSINRFNKLEATEEFDGVMVCTGRLSEPMVPTFPNQDSFTGTTIHSQALKGISSFEDLKVLVVGDGNSAVDAAVELSTVAQQVYLSTRNGFWLFPKVGPKGLPYDMHILRRDIHLLKTFCSEIANRYVENFLETKINHDIFRIKPSFRALDKHPTVNDDLPDKIITGRVIIKGEVSKFEKDGVIFEQEEEEVTAVDCVIFATGYKMKFSFLDEEIYLKDGDEVNLYKWVFPIGPKHHTLAFIGFVESNGPQIPLAESQTRWASRVFAGKAHLPNTETIKSFTASKHAKLHKDLRKIDVDYVEYMDELAEEYGVKPDSSYLLFKDSSLFWACFTGPFLPYQYRLVGPNHVNNARDLILNCKQRVKDSFNTRNPCSPFNSM